MILRIAIAVMAFCALSLSANAQSFSGLPSATVPLTGAENVPMDQGAGCNSHTTPCSTVQAASAWIGQPITAPSGCPAAISAPFSYQECFDTSGSLPVLKQWFHGSWSVVYTLDTTTGIMTPPVGGGTATIASNSTTDLCSSPQAAVTISGTTTITGFGSTCSAGIIKFVRFSGVLTLTYNGTSLIIPGAANVTTAVGDAMVAEYLGSGNWAVLLYQPVGGGPIGLTKAQVIAALGYTPANQASPTFTGTVTFPDGSTWTSGGLAPSGRPIGYNALATVVLPHVPNNATLALTSTATYPTGVIRDDYLVGNGAPPVLFKPLTGTCAANSLVSDGGSCVNETSGDGNSWKAQYGAGGVDVREWGAKCDGATNDSAAIIASLAAATNASLGKIVLPDATCYSTAQIIVPPGVTLDGTVFVPSNPPAGSKLLCASSVANACLVVSGDGTSAGLGNGAAGAQYLTVAYSGTPPTNSDNIEVLGGYNPVINHLFAYNAYNGFGFVGVCTTPPSTNCVYGISADPDHIYTGVIANDHIYVNNWPELRISHGRFGMSGAGDLNGGAYIYFTGGAGGGGEGPNSFYVSDSIFNQGANAPTHFAQWANITGAGANVVEWKFEHIHVEDSGTGALFATDVTNNILNRLNISDSTFNTVSRPVWGLNAATQPSEWEITGNEFFCSTFTLSPTPSIQSVAIIGNRIDCASHFTSTAGTDTLELTSNSYGGNLTLDGTANWGSLNVNGGSFTAGSLVNSTTAGSVLSVDMAGQNSLFDCSATIGLAFGGTSLAGGDYATRACKWQITGNTVTVYVNLILSAVSGSGAATLVGLPKAISSNPYASAGGPTAPYAANLQSLTGTLGLAGVGGTTTATFTQSSATGTTAVSESNFTNTSQVSATIVYPFQ